MTTDTWNKETVLGMIATIKPNWANPELSCAARPCVANTTMMSSTSAFTDYIALVKALVDRERETLPDAFVKEFDAIISTYQPTAFTRY